MSQEIVNAILENVLELLDEAEPDMDGDMDELTHERLAEYEHLLEDPAKLQALADELGAERLSMKRGDRGKKESSSPLLDAVMERGALAGITVAEEIRRKVRRLARKKFPPRR